LNLFLFEKVVLEKVEYVCQKKEKVEYNKVVRFIHQTK